MSYCSITCRCGHTDDLDRFTACQPQDHFHCPECGWQWKITQDLPTVYKSGFIMPGNKHIVTVNEPTKKGQIV